MKAAAIAFVGAFALVGIATMSTSGCTQEDCNRSALEPVGPVNDLRLTGADPGLLPESGTFQLTGSAVIIRYRQAGVDYRVEYAVSDMSY